jgi:hypothetical protein
MGTRRCAPSRRLKGRFLSPSHLPRPILRYGLGRKISAAGSPRLISNIRKVTCSPPVKRTSSKTTCPRSREIQRSTVSRPPGASIVVRVPSHSNPSMLRAPRDSEADGTLFWGAATGGLAVLSVAPFGQGMSIRTRLDELSTIQAAFLTGSQIAAIDSAPGISTALLARPSTSMAIVPRSSSSPAPGLDMRLSYAATNGLPGTTGVISKDPITTTLPVIMLTYLTRVSHRHPGFA